MDAADALPVVGDHDIVQDPTHIGGVNSEAMRKHPMDGSDIEELKEEEDSKGEEKGDDCLKDHISLDDHLDEEHAGGGDDNSDDHNDDDHDDHDDHDDDDVFSNRSHSQRSPRSSLGGSLDSNCGGDEKKNVGSETADKERAAAAAAAAAVNVEADESYGENCDDHHAFAHMHSMHEHYDGGDDDLRDRFDGHSRHQRLPRLSGMSAASGFSQGGVISNISQYEEEEAAEGEESYERYRPRGLSTSVGGTPRAAFRTPSAVRAMQMSSPSPSVVFGTSSPRSARQRRRQQQQEQQQGLQSGHSGEAWLSSPPMRPSTRTSTRTPSRFRVIKPEPAPLVLLHATLMPTRWAWADVLDRWGETGDEQTGEAGDHGKGNGGNGDSAAGPSRAFRRLQTSWCRLQSFLGGDTVAERGLLLPHPQNDYEVLEERLLEALELPVRRRARILECGHYLGPQDEDGDGGADEDEEELGGGGGSEGEDGDEDDDGNESGSGTEYGGSRRQKERRHWCGMCRAEIRYEPLRAERVFRVKVYASNGLMTAGAWAACWQEMERVDVEVEPIVTDVALLRELGRMRAAQDLRLRMMGLEGGGREEEEEEEEEEKEEEEEVRGEEEEDVEDDEELVGGKEMGKNVNDTENDTENDIENDIENEEADRDVDEQTARAATPASGAGASAAPSEEEQERRRREAAEARLREIYGQSSPAAESTTRTKEPTQQHEDQQQQQQQQQHQEHQEHQQQQQQPHYQQHQHHQYQQPHESASLGALLMAAGRVILRDHKHMAITILSAMVILLVALRPATAPLEVVVSTVMPAVMPAAVPAPAPVVDPVTAELAVFNPRAAAAEAVEIIMTTTSVVELVETVTQRQTVQVFETVTETETETVRATAAAVAKEERGAETETKMETGTEAKPETETEETVAETVTETEIGAGETCKTCGACTSGAPAALDASTLDLALPQKKGSIADVADVADVAVEPLPLMSLDLAVAKPEQGQVGAAGGQGKRCCDTSSCCGSAAN